MSVLVTVYHSLHDKEVEMHPHYTIGSRVLYQDINIGISWMVPDKGISIFKTINTSL